MDARLRETMRGLDLRAEIERLRKERNAVILAHYYQTPEDVYKRQVGNPPGFQHGTGCSGRNGWFCKRGSRVTRPWLLLNGGTSPGFAAPGTASNEYLMRNPVRAAALLAAAVLLLAAGKAPNGDLLFLNDIDTPSAEMAPEPVPFIDESPDFPEPELGLILPEAGNLTRLVADVRDLEGAKMDEDYNCLAIAVYFESKGEPLDGQLAVAQVILNRVEDGLSLIHI